MYVGVSITYLYCTSPHWSHKDSSTHQSSRYHHSHTEGGLQKGQGRDKVMSSGCLATKYIAMIIRFVYRAILVLLVCTYYTFTSWGLTQLLSTVPSRVSRRTHTVAAIGDTSATVCTADWNWIGGRAVLNQLESSTGEMQSVFAEEWNCDAWGIVTHTTSNWRV